MHLKGRGARIGDPEKADEGKIVSECKTVLGLGIKII